YRLQCATGIACLCRGLLRGVGMTNDKRGSGALAPDVRRGTMRAGSRAATHACVWGLITVFVIAAATPADARRHSRGTRSQTSQSSGGYSPPYSAIVVDANSGATLHESSPDGVRHPASLTKIMTLYMLFEQLDAGKLTLESQIPVSEHAADQSP